MLDASEPVFLSGGLAGPLLTDASFRGADDGSDEVVAWPYLQEALADVDVNDRAGVVFANTDLLPGDSDESVGRHPAADLTIDSVGQCCTQSAIGRCRIAQSPTLSATSVIDNPSSTTANTA
ncbi:MAG TPA: hypothetical protein VMT88_01455 [Actinomycetes bacterium]|nr:hypothetical protein [Actinomycetes bacterium]